MKDQVRVMGIDDGPFRKGDGNVPVVGAVVRCPNYLEGVIVSECKVDGEDANDVICRMVEGSRFSQQIRVVMIDGIALGGFNVVDIRELHRRLGVPIMTITRDPPDLSSMKSALMGHFPDWERRFDIIARTGAEGIDAGPGKIFVAMEGIALEEGSGIVHNCTVQGLIPEPIRLAHLISTALVKGESKGRS